jgi:enoyl-CoA hydratase/carnithine racemase
MPVLVEKRNHVMTLTLSRPDSRNAWGDDYNKELPVLLAEAADDDEVRCVVLTGDEAGGAFSAGANLKDTKTHNTASAEAFIKRIGGFRKFPTNALGDFPKPVLCAVNGYAIGVGAIVTFCCDMIIASEKAEWRLPQVALGIVPNHGGATRMARFAGRGNAMKLAMGFPLKAEEAHRVGLAQWLEPHDRMMEKAMEIADHLCGLPPLAARLVKESLNRGMDIPNITDAAMMDVYRFMVLEQTEDKTEAHAAWREKRTPEFKGR